ncbi:MAG: HDOD domain-containing protein [Phycisphaerales bacterium]
MPAATISGTKRTELILHEVDALPTLSSVATRLMRITSTDDADLKEIIRLIESDPSLTAKVLSMCRRAELGLGSRVTTVERAVLLLGLDALKSIVLGVQAVEWTGRADSNGAGAGGEARFDRAAFWRHCIGVACCAELIAGKHRELGVNPGEAFVAGLLHDLGKIALQMVLPRTYAQVIETAEVRQANIAEVEASIIGLDHHTAGKRLAERWELPRIFTETIWLHGQRPEALPAGSNRNLIGVVRAADAACRSLHLGWSGNHSLGANTGEVCESAGLHAERVEAVLPKVLESTSARCGELGLEDKPSEQMVVEALASANRRLARLNTTIERRARESDRRVRVVEEVREFLGRVRPDRGTIETLTEIVRSAARVLGPGRFAVVYRAGKASEGADGGGGDRSVWVWLGFDRDGKRISSDAVEGADHGGSGRGSGGALERQARRAPGAGAILDGPGGGLLELDPGESARECGIAALVHDRDSAVRALGESQVTLLQSAWKGALGSAAREEAGARMGEQLAEANRRLGDAQRELAESQSMARLAELTAGAAHEFNNPLAVIAGRAQLLSMTVVDPKHKSAVASIVQASNQLSSLVQRLHAVARPPAPVFKATDVKGVIEEARGRALARSPRKDAQGAPVEIRINTPADLPAARFDRELMAQALTEVLVNALEAEPRDFVDVRVQIDGVDDRLLVVVTDTGRGMSPFAVKHALDPFFSEKSAGRQTGLGLALAHRLLGVHGGTVRIESAPGDGTIVSIALKEWRWEPAAGTRG